MLQCVEYFNNIKGPSFKGKLRVFFNDENFLKNAFNLSEYNSQWEDIEKMIVDYLIDNFKRDNTANSFNIESLDKNLNDLFKNRLNIFSERYKKSILNITTDFSNTINEIKSAQMFDNIDNIFNNILETFEQKYRNNVNNNILEDFINGLEKSKSELSDISINNENIDNIFEQIITLSINNIGETVINNFNNNLEELRTGILDQMLDRLVTQGGLETNPLVENERLFNFDNPVNLTFGIKTYENYIENLITNSIFETIFIKTKSNEKYPYTSFITSDNQLNKNLNIFKNELWDVMYEYYRKNYKDGKVKSLPNNENSLYKIENISAQDGYSITLNENLFLKLEHETSIYNDVISFIKDEMESAIKNNDKSLKIVRNKSLSIAKAYLNTMVLVNFDNYLIQNHSDMLGVNMDTAHTYSLPSNGNPKYKLNFKWGKKIKLDNSGLSDINDHKTSVIKLIANVIPFYTHVKRVGWVPDPRGLTVGKSNLDSIGALMNSINIYEEFEINGVNKTFGEILLDFDKGLINFETILKILSETDTNKSIYARHNVIKSVYEFLYGVNGVSLAIQNELAQNPSAISNLINPETVIINHLRNTVKNVYNEVNIKGKSKVIDFIDLDAADEYKFLDLLNNLEEYWNKSNGNVESIENIENYTIDDYIDLLSNPEKGGLDIPEKAKSKFRTFLKNKKDFEISKSEAFKRAFKYLTNPKSYDDRVKNINDNRYSDEKSVSERVSILKEDAPALISLGLKDLFSFINSEINYNTVTTYKNNAGKNLPTLGVANVSSLLPLALAKSNNFFTKNKGLYKRTQIISELVGEQGPKNFSEVNAIENFKTAFIKHFLESRIIDKEFVVQPVNFSDRSSITELAVNTEATLGINGKNIRESNSDDLKNQLYINQFGYYEGAKDKILNTMRKVFNISDNEDFTIKDLEQKYDEINNLAIEQNVQPSFLFNNLVKEAFKKEYIEVGIDFHYSIYKTKVNNKSFGLIKVNQFLKTMIDVYTDVDKFKIWAEDLENHFKDANSVWKIPLKQINFSENRMSNANKIKVLSDNFGKDNINIDDENNLILITSDGTLTELAKQFLWGKNLIITQYLNATVKDAYLHPTGTDYYEINDIKEDIKQFVKEEDSRTTAFTKRMSIFGANMNVVGKNATGIKMTHKVAFSDDPIAPVFNYTGDNRTQDVMDGGGLTSGIFNLLVISSLPGFNLQKTQKPIALSISEYISTMLKFATFGITNEEIRKSELSDNPLHVLFRKMHDIHIWDKDINGNDIYQSLIRFPSKTDPSKYNTFELSTIIPDYHIEYNNEIKKVEGLIHIANNIYKTVFEDGSSYEFEVNTIYDLWQGLGGAYTYSKNQDGSFSESNYSQEAIANLMIQHDHYKTGLDLKDKMIAIYGPNSMGKNGAININNSGDIFNPNEKLMYMNFDMTFYGIQLDSHSSTEGSNVNEITQVMSAIAENASTPEYYNLVYGAIEKVVEKGLEKFKSSISEKDAKGNIKVDENGEPVIYKKEILDAFIKTINKSDQINNAKYLIASIEEELKDKIPIDNKAIYKQFISFLISETNAEFIRRKFPGSASVLRMSYGFMQIFENNKGDKYLFNDLLRLFKEQNYELEQSEGESTRDYNIRKAKHVLDNDPNFNNELISIRSIRPLDTITVNKDIEINGTTITSGTPIVIKDYNQYFSLKEILHAENQNILKVRDEFPEEEIEYLNVFRHYKKARDLKPVDITFEQMFEGSENPIERSIWDSESFEFKWKLLNDKNFKNSELYNEFVDYISIVDETAGLRISNNLKGADDLIIKYADRWINRTFNLAKHNKTFKFLSDFDINENRFVQMFLTKDGIDNLKYRFNDNYTNYYEISNYIHRNPENIHTNVHRKNFGFDKDYSLQEITKELFTLTDSKIIKSKRRFYDIVIQDIFNKNDLYVALEGLNYQADNNGNLYTRISLDVKSSTPSVIAKEAKIFTNSDGTERLDEYGKYMYDLPKGAKIYVTEKGQEILFINNTEDKTAFETLEDFIHKQKGYDYIQVRDNGYNTVDYILGDPDNDNYLKLLDILKNSINNKQLRKLFRDKHRFYNNFRNGIHKNIDTYKKDSDKYDKPKIANLFEKVNEKNQKFFLNEYIAELAELKYASFQLSTKSISARIPAQGMQSFMGMDTVGFIDGTDNDVYVSHWQLFLQGSDFDIDKIYMMMYDFKNGQFQGWSPYFDVLQFEKSRNIPLPTGKSYTAFSDKNGIKSKEGDWIIDIHNSAVLNIDSLLSRYPEKTKFLDKLILILKTLNKNHKDYIYSSDEYLLNAIKWHQSYYSERGFKNFIVDKMLQVTEDPNNQIAFSKPISFGVYDGLGKELNANKKPMRNLDGFTSGIQQEINAVGKKVIGIAATGEKIYFSLVKYFGDFYSQDLTKDEIINSNKYFRKHYTINGKDYFLDDIAGVTVNKTTAELQKEILSDWILKEVDIDVHPEYLEKDITTDQFKQIVIQELSDNKLEDVSLTISAILSLATDNAKELMLSKINAGVDMAGIHLYLIMLGVDPVDITKFMINEKIKKIGDSGKQDSFEWSYYQTLENRIRNAIKTNPSDLNLSNFLKIYNDSREIIRLGGYLRVNQGSKATEEELSKLLNNLENTIIDQEQALLNSTSQSDLLLAIKSDKYYMDDSKISKIFDKANSWNIIGSEINIYEFFNVEWYRNAVIDYYNLIKSTFNVLDVLTSSEHFNIMFKAFAEVDKVATDWTNKHYFIKSGNINKILDVVNKTYPNLSYKLSKNLKRSGVSRLNPEIIGKVLDFYDNSVIFNFLKNESISLNIGRIMDMYGLDKIKILKPDITEATFETLTKDELENYIFDPSVGNDPFILTVNTPQNIAIFRQIMEDYIIPREKYRHNNGFLKKLNKNSQGIYNMKNRNSYYRDVSNWSELEDIELGIFDMIKSLGSVDDDDNAHSYKLAIKSIDSMPGRVTNIELLDLLTMYSLIVNENKFGGNRMTNFLSRDIVKDGSISKKFLDYEMSLTHRYVDNLIESTINDSGNIDNFLMNLFKIQEFRWTKGVQKLRLGDGEYASVLKVNKYLTFNYTNLGLTSVLESNIELADNIVDTFVNKHVNLEKDC